MAKNKGGDKNKKTPGNVTNKPEIRKAVYKIDKKTGKKIFVGWQ